MLIKKRKPVRHGMTNTRAYKKWRGMMRRCYDNRRDESSSYIERNITVDSEWHNFLNFYRDMGDPPKNKTLDRIDNTKGYSKDNCRWATKHEQDNNRRSNRIIKFAGLTKTVSEWARLFNIAPRYFGVFKARISHGWSLSRAACSPIFIAGSKINKFKEAEPC